MYKYYYNAITRPDVAKVAHQHISTIKPEDPGYESEVKFVRVKAGGMYAYRKHTGGFEFKPMMKRCNTLEDLLEAMRDYNASCFVTFMAKDGTIYSVSQNGTFEYGPLDKDGAYDTTGINWRTCWFFTKEAAEAFRAELLADGGGQVDPVKYHENLDTWSVHFHI